MYPFIIVIDEPEESYGIEAGLANEISVKLLVQSSASAEMMTKSLLKGIKGKPVIGSISQL